MNKQRVSVLFLTFALMLLCFSGCNGKTPTVRYNEDNNLSMPDDGIVTSNDRLELLWNDIDKCAMMRDKEKNVYWSTTPYEYLEAGGSTASVLSPLNITVLNSTTLEWEQLKGYTEVIESGRMSGEECENGIVITYYFDAYKIAVPLKYTINSETLSITVVSKDIVEAGNYKIVSVAVAPFLNSVSSSYEKGYVFIPSGSGALMYNSENTGETRAFKGEVYGTDYSRMHPEDIFSGQTIKLPVFGTVGGGKALFSIITEGAEAAQIYAESGNEKTKYSNAYPVFYLRGYDVFETDNHRLNYSDLSQCSDKKSNSDFTVSYYPLYGDEADYNGFANVYKNYLKKNNQLVSSGNEKKCYSVDFLGGIETTSVTGGIAHKNTNVMTSFNDAEKILSELNKDIGIAPTVKMTGYGDSGINCGKLAGGFELSNLYGSKKEHDKIEELCRKWNSKLYTDFDIVNFSKSSNGFSYLNDSAKSASLHVCEHKEVLLPLHNFDNNSTYRILSRLSLNKAAELLTKKAKDNNISSISLSTLGYRAYSDYSNDSYNVKENMGKDVVGILKNIKNNKISISVDSANMYAAGFADTIFNIPTDDGNYDCFDEVIPFYGMIYSGEKETVVSAVNTDANPQKQIMNAAITGSSLNFSLIANFDISMNETNKGNLFGCLYKDVKGTIKESVLKYNDIFEKVKDAGIRSYISLDNGISVTVFNNGSVLYANHNDFEINSDVGKLLPYDFILQ